MRTVKNLLTFYGRLRRRHYGYFVLVSMALAVAVFGTLAAIGEPPKDADPPLFVVGGLAVLIWFVASISFTVRRLHDMSLSGWVYLILIVARLVPFVSWLVLAWLIFKRGTKGANVFGPDPCAPPHAALADVFDGPRDGSQNTPQPLRDGLRT